MPLAAHSGVPAQQHLPQARRPQPRAAVPVAGLSSTGTRHRRIGLHHAHRHCPSKRLLSGLGIRQPVVVVGHSYGGLIGALHAAQSPGLVQSIVQIDPTPEFPDELIDPSLKLVPRLARILQLLTLLRVDDPVIAQAARELPPEVVARLRRRPLAAVRSLNGAIAEIHLLQEIRRVVAASEEARQCPRLVISAAPLQQGKNWLRTLLGKDRQEQAYTAAAHALHRRHAAQNDASRWTTLPYGHVGLVTNRSGADSVAAEIVRFLS